MPIVSAALTAPPQGNGGWQLAIEPLLRVGQQPEAWALAVLHLRAR